MTLSDLGGSCSFRVEMQWKSSPDLGQAAASTAPGQSLWELPHPELEINQMGREKL